MKKFSLLTLFSIIDGRLSIEGMDSVYEPLNHYFDDDDISTIGLGMMADKLKSINPKWFQDATFKLAEIVTKCPIKERTREQFDWIMNYLQTVENPIYEVESIVTCKL